MPFYDLRCAHCDKKFNIMASMAEKTEKRIPCPDCGSFDMETIFTSAPAYLKGSEEQGCPHRRVCGSNCRHAHS